MPRRRWLGTLAPGRAGRLCSLWGGSQGGRAGVKGPGPGRTRGFTPALQPREQQSRPSAAAAHPQHGLGPWALGEERGPTSLWGLATGTVRYTGAGLGLLGGQPPTAQRSRLAEPASPLMGLGRGEALLVERTKRPSKSFEGQPKAPGPVLAGQTRMYETGHRLALCEWPGATVGPGGRGGGGPGRVTRLASSSGGQGLCLCALNPGTAQSGLGPPAAAPRLPVGGQGDSE